MRDFTFRAFPLVRHNLGEPTAYTDQAINEGMAQVLPGTQTEQMRTLRSLLFLLITSSIFFSSSSDFQIEIVEAPLDNREDLCTAKVGPDTIAVLWASAKSGWGMGEICPRKKSGGSRRSRCRS